MDYFPFHQYMGCHPKPIDEVHDIFVKMGTLHHQPVGDIPVIPLLSILNHIKPSFFKMGFGIPPKPVGAS